MPDFIFQKNCPFIWELPFWSWNSFVIRHIEVEMPCLASKCRWVCIMTSPPPFPVYHKYLWSSSWSLLIKPLSLGTRPRTAEADTTMADNNAMMIRGLSGHSLLRCQLTTALVTSPQCLRWLRWHVTRALILTIVINTIHDSSASVSLILERVGLSWCQ